MTLSLHTLPIDMIYRILDHLDGKTLFLSIRNVCQYINAVIDSYYPYQVEFHFLSYSNKDLLPYKKTILFSVRLNK